MATCKNCQAQITWQSSDIGRAVPIEGRSKHFCSFYDWIIDFNSTQRLDRTVCIAPSQRILQEFNTQLEPEESSELNNILNQYGGMTWLTWCAKHNELANRAKSGELHVTK